MITCTVCGAELSRTAKTIAKLPHTPKTVPGKEATCKETGLTEGSVCEVCGEVLTAQTVIEKKAHTPGEAVRENEVPATCTKEGSYDEVISCTVCGEELSRTAKTVAKKAHTPGAPTRENEKAATCTEAASYVEVVTCSVCGSEISRIVKTEGKALGHAWGAWVVTKEASCSETGTKTRTCGNDPAHTETESIPKTAHVDADGDNLCDNCGATIKESFRCGMCPTYEKYKDVPVVGWFVTFIHFFVHWAQQISHWT